MSRTSTQKRIHYVRAVYAQGKAPKITLEAALRVALAQLKKMLDTEVNHADLGTIAIRDRGVLNADFITLSIGLGVPNEAMGTLGLNVATVEDTNQPQTPLQGRAFKLADTFCLIDDNDLLICMDGRIRLPAVNFYLSNLLGLANAAPDAQAFELIGRMDQDKQKTLDTEGVKEMRVSSSAYAAGQAIDEAHVDNWLHKGWSALLENFRGALAEEAKTDKEKELLVDHWADLNVSAIFKVNGGSRGEPTVVRSLEEIALDAQKDAPDGTDVTLITRRGNPVGMDSLTLKTQKSIKRLDKQNDLDYADAWNKLMEYRQELIGTTRWKT